MSDIVMPPDSVSVVAIYISDVVEGGLWSFCN